MSFSVHTNSLRTKGIVTMLLVAAALVFSGCGARTVYDAAGVDLRRDGWDTLHVAPRFVQHTTLGVPRPVAMDSVRVYVFDASYDLLYAGPPAPVPLPDRRLGNRERLLVEACGYLDGYALCQQTFAAASPKRLRAVPEISFPEDEDFQQGAYRLRFVVERKRFDAPTWEPVETPAPPGGYLLAYVSGYPSAAVRVPFSESRGRFDLTGYAGYEDFSFFLRSALFGGDSTEVRFEVHAGLGRGVQRVAAAALPVRRKTRSERAEALRRLVRQAVEQIVERLGGRPTEHPPVAYIDAWSYDRFEQTYEAHVEARWTGGERHGRRLTLRGVLEVGASGAPARFRADKASRTVVFRWQRLVKGEEMALDPLDPDGEEEARRET